MKAVTSALLVCTLSLCSLAAEPAASQAPDKEFKDELARIGAVQEPIRVQRHNDLAAYERFADEVREKWRGRDPEQYARLMLNLCGPISSGRFGLDSDRQLARKYALSALERSDETSLQTETDLIGQIVVSTTGPYAVKGQEFAQERSENLRIRLHAWKRLLDAVDPTWDPNDMPFMNIAVPIPEGYTPPPGGPPLVLMSGVAPEAVKDPVIRAAYEAALEENRRKAERYNQQGGVRSLLKYYPPIAERLIIMTYSEPPDGLDELKASLDGFQALDAETKARILGAVR